ncbi:hypothetical protein DPM19_25580 [Actinomadura craniellae]|uniref:Uncharacterized protein n=1 Tax=Actinomadura craniellae TaxID=2231787 RepID=A0A365H089_9ACTN|nr:hypothetical protein [Actinomadura craniellae]RAY12505.1 hypothetical protein DPM19_25580 [Actinomadura craniellae]
MSDVTTVKSLLPTRKWWAAFVTAFSAFLISWITAGEFSKEILVMLIGVLAQAAVSYLVPNSDAPGGVPVKVKKT